MPTFGLRVGVDTVAVDQVVESLEHFGDRYSHRIFTDRELSDADGHCGVLATKLAARFAAKEATIKLLRPEAVRPPWRSIELCRAPAGWCEITLYDLALDLARIAGIQSLSVSFTHEDNLATAVVVALCTSHIPQLSS